MKKLFIICGSLLLAGCQTTSTVITKQVPVVIKPPETLYDCPIVEKFPTNIINKQLANLIVKLDKNNKTCHKQLQLIKKYVEESEKNWSNKK